MNKLFAGALILFFITSFAQASAITGFKNIDYIDPDTKINIKSVQWKNYADRVFSIKTENISTKYGICFFGNTQIFDKNATLLWNMPIFIGNYKLLTSPDGKILILLGSFGFGSKIECVESSRFVFIFESGILIKRLSLQELFGLS